MPEDDEPRDDEPRDDGRDSQPADDADSDDSDNNETSADGYVGTYDKLVRDEIPDLIREDGNVPVTRQVDGAEYDRYLAAKLVEEAQEYADAIDARSTSPDATSDATEPLEELADLATVIDAIVETRSERATADETAPASRTTLDTLKRTKTAERGGFTDGIVLERIDASESDP